MLEEITKHDNIGNIIEYVRQEKRAVPYLWLNLDAFPKSGENVRLWCDINQDRICGVYMMYFNCMHFYSMDSENYPADITKSFIDEFHPQVIMFQDKSGKKILPLIDEAYNLDVHCIFDMDKAPHENKGFSCRSTIASRDDIDEIADLMLTEKLYSEVYDKKDTLLKQMRERFDNGIGRSYIYCAEGGKIIGACSTSAESKDIAVLGGLIVHKDYRKNGLMISADLMLSLCNVLSGEGKSIIASVNYRNIHSLVLHERLGAVKTGDYYKFVSK